MSQRMGVLLFVAGLLVGFLLSSLPVRVGAQSDEAVRLLRSIDERLRRIHLNTDELAYRFNYVRDGYALRVRPIK
ncbi:MAG: hypothetical protein NZ959_05695 [Armatimonadetes bacterium]|nr:hypothetical protein [Armatimonadota bacterium]MDW8122419.1 hypothetical protein [Armatimonadota bacterium]